MAWLPKLVVVESATVALVVVETGEDVPPARVDAGVRGDAVVVALTERAPLPPPLVRVVAVVPGADVATVVVVVFGAAVAGGASAHIWLKLDG